MGAYSRLAMKVFGGVGTNLSFYFPEIKLDLKKSRMKYTFQEYVSVAIFTSILVFLLATPVIAFILYKLQGNLLFGLVASSTVSAIVSVVLFFLFLGWPKEINKRRARKIDSELPFASLYLASLSNSKLPLPKTIDIFARFAGYGELSKEVGAINADIKTFGLDVNSAIERELERTPSKNLKELFWGILSTNKTGGNLSAYLKEKSKNYIAEYRRKINEFSHQLEVFMELYIVALIVGVLLFTTVMSLISILGGAGNIIVIQFIMIFVFIPLISSAFILMVKSSSPGEEK